MKHPWPHLDFWKSGECQVVEERLDEPTKRATTNPRREDRYAALAITPFETVRVAIIGQDPYPDPRFCTGIAFSTPKDQKETPPTLREIFDEYVADLHYERPTSGDLTPWCKQGVLLWNSIPTCDSYRAGSHRDWTEWEWLTKEIVQKLSQRKIVFIFLGSIASAYQKYIAEDSPCKVIVASHPSPRANRASWHPFRGSRIFSTANDILFNDLDQEPIDWKLPNGQTKGTQT